MSLSGSEKENTEKLAAMWMYAAQMGSLPPPTVRKMTPPSRPIMLIPASNGSSSLLAASPPPPPPTGIMLPPPPPMMPYRGMPVPYMRPGSVLYAHPHPGSLPGTYRTQRSSKSAGMKNKHRQRRGGQYAHPGKMEANRRQRCKSEADMVDGQNAFQYTGLDRAIADSFLARQELSNTGSHVDYSSSSSAASETYGQDASRASSKTKIICRDVVM